MHLDITKSTLWKKWIYGGYLPQVSLLLGPTEIQKSWRCLVVMVWVGPMLGTDIYVVLECCRSSSFWSFLSAFVICFVVVVLFSGSIPMVRKMYSKRFLWDVNKDAGGLKKKQPMDENKIHKTLYSQPEPRGWFSQPRFGHTRQESERACVAAAHLTAALWVNTRILSFQGQEELLLGI